MTLAPYPPRTYTVHVPDEMTVERRQEIRDCAQRALDLINERGWTQGAAVTPAGEHCLVGALEDVTGLDIGLITAMYDILGDAIGLPEDVPIEVWNDALDRDKRDVTSLLEQVRDAYA